MDINKKKHTILSNVADELIQAIGENNQREGLIKTPDRFAKAYSFLTQGYNLSLETITNGAIFEENIQDMVIVKNIEFYSLCEHHLLPFFGKAHVAYIPNQKIIGISKIPRIVELYARRLQVQERLTNEIANGLSQIIHPKGIAVSIEAQHLCMMMRGIEKQNSSLITNCMIGEFKNNYNLRNEFLNSIRK